MKTHEIKPGRSLLGISALFLTFIFQCITAPLLAGDAYKTAKEIVAESDSFKILGQETRFYLRRGFGCWALEAAILASHDDPPIAYTEITLHAYDDRKTELPLRVAVPKGKIYLISGTNTLWGGTAFGDYLFNMGKNRQLASVQLIRGGEKHTFVFPKND